MQEKVYISCVPGVDGKIHPLSFVQQGPRYEFSHPHQEHMTVTYKH